MPHYYKCLTNILKKNGITTFFIDFLRFYIVFPFFICYFVSNMKYPPRKRKNE